MEGFYIKNDLIQILPGVGSTQKTSTASDWKKMESVGEDWSVPRRQTAAKEGSRH